MGARRPQSVTFLWEYYLKDTKLRRATCKFCSMTMSYQSSMLKSHLKMKHPAQFDEYLKTVERNEAEMALINAQDDAFEICESKPDVVPSVLSDTPESSSSEVHEPPAKILKPTNLKLAISKTLSLEDKKKIDDKLMNMLVNSYFPISMVEEQSFAQFVKTLNPLYEMPSKVILTNRISIMHTDCQSESRKIIIDHAKTASLTIECWTSTLAELYMAVTAHFVNKDFVPISVMLQCVNLGNMDLTDPPTGIAMAGELEKVVKDWYLTNRVTLAVTDDTHNVAKALGIVGLDYFKCYANEFNNAVQESIILFDDTTRKVKAVVDHFIKSNEAMDLILEHQSQIEKIAKPKRLKTCDLSRWDSIFDMMKRVSELKTSLVANIPCFENTQFIITPEEWTAIQQFCIILGPIEEVRDILRFEKYLTGSMPIVLTNGLMSVLEEMRKESYRSDILIILETLKQQLSKRFPDIEGNNTLAVCTFLDPRFKEYVFSSNTAAEKTRQSVIELVRQIMVANGDKCLKVEEVAKEPTPTPTDGKFSVWKRLQERVAAASPGRPSILSRAEQEVEAYCKDSLLARDRCPLQWWRTHRVSYPYLSQLMLRRGGLAMSVVPCDRLFTEAGRLLQERRARLPCSQLERRVFLHSNHDNVRTLKTVPNLVYY